MKIIFLNIWHGNLLDQVTDFIQEHSKDTDIFCFQEVDEEVKGALEKVLQDYQGVAINKFSTHQHFFNQATYARKSLNMLSSGGVLEKSGDDIGLGVYVEIAVQGGSLFVCNVHGVSQPGKLDTPSRLIQSQGFIDFFKDKKGPKIIGGDLNVSLETESVQMFEENGYRDLIKDYAIKTTRNHYSWDLYPHAPLYYSDYVFTSKEVKIKDFTVIENEISDHLPMVLEIDL